MRTTTRFGDPAALAACFGACLILALCAAAGTTQDNSDFLQFYAGAKLLGPDLYSIPRAVELQHSLAPLPQTVDHPNWWMSRPPFEYLIFLPFSRFGYTGARRVWMGLALAAIGVFVWLWPGRKRDALLYVGFCFPVLQGLRVAQDCFLLLCVLAGAAALRAGGWDFCAGLVASLSMAKPSTLMLVPLSAIAFRSRRYAAGLACGLVSIYIVSAILVRDPHWALAYVRHTLAVSPHTTSLPFWSIPLLAAWITRWCFGRDAHTVFAVLACAGTALSPRALFYDLAWAVPLALLLLPRRPGVALALYLYPTLAAVCWYYWGWDGARTVVAGLTVASMVELDRDGIRSIAGGATAGDRACVS